MSDLEKTMETTEKVGSTLATIVPQLFFDVIARVVPGFAIIWGLYLALIGGPLLDVNRFFAATSAIAPTSNAFFIFSITILVFYVASIVFYGIWSLFIHLYFVAIIRLGLYQKDERKKFIEVLYASPDFTLRYDYIKLHAPAAGNRITKLKAEIHMSGALTAAFGICFLLSLAGFFHSTLSHNELVLRTALFFLCTLGLYFSNRHFSTRLYRAVGSYSELLRYKSSSFSLPVDFH
jgi:hypothetical protein